VDDTPLSLAREFINGLPNDPRLITDENRGRLLDLLEMAHQDLPDMTQATLKANRSLRRTTILSDLAVGLLRGMLRDNVLIDGFDKLDQYEWSEWMRQNGCQLDSINSSPVRACYDYVFGYVRGNRCVGAGTGTRALLRFLLTYKGSILYTLRAPMGDFLFGPLYRLLRARRVKFEFFHRLDKLALDEDRREIAAIVLTRQVRLKYPAREYYPLIKLSRHRRSWPAHPRYEQIEDGATLKQYDLESAWTDWPNTLPVRTLRRRSLGDGVASPDDEADTFDLAILGVGLGALGPICDELKTACPKWGNFLNRVATAQTMGVQLWLESTTEQLGWPDPRTLLTAFEKTEDPWRSAPLTTWEDNSELITLESHAQRPPRSLAYFVGVFPDAKRIPDPGPRPQFPREEFRRAREAVLSFVEDRLPVLWPNAINPQTGRFRWGLLTAPRGQTGRKRLDAQYLRVNINPSDRYVLSVPGSVQHRLRADQSGIGNLFLAGDWVRTGLSAGCIEAAVMAGRAAARAITGANMTIPGNDVDGTLVPISLLPVVNILQKLRRGAAAGVGVMDAYCAIASMPFEDVSRKLPPGLHLCRRTRSDLHPLVLLFSKQRNVRPGFVPFGGIDYHEFIELIPYVERDDGPSGGPFSFMPYLLLDQLPPVLIGVGLYGFNKRLAKISSQAGAFEIRSDLGEVRAYFQPKGLPGDSEQFPNLADVRDLLEHPLISQTPTRSWIYSYLDFHFDAATFQATSGKVAIEGQEIQFDSILDQPFGAFRFMTNWNLSFPLSSGTSPENLGSDAVRRLASIWTQATLGRLNSRF
jgi:uncharacterized protein with NAD-binding domain and iron-sulfur cluster